MTSLEIMIPLCTETQVLYSSPLQMTEVQSTKGLNKVRLASVKFVSYGCSYQYSTAAQQDPNFGWNSDVNSGKPLGIGRTIATIGTGVRSSANNYLEAAAARENLRIVTNAQVTRLLFSKEGEDEEPVVTGVEFAQSSNGKYFLDCVRG
jgi:choline dehydrogenase-like flavoprotein